MKKIKKYNEFVNNDIYVDVDVKSLIETVRCECGNKSDLNVIWNNASYKKVIENGKESIPYLLENLSMVWFHALEEITGEKPYPKGTKPQEKREEWKKWAIQNGY